MLLFCLKQVLKIFFCTALFLAGSLSVFSQPTKLDSLKNILNASIINDTNRVQLLWRTAAEASTYNPDTALILSFEAIALARKLKYLEGESKAVGIMANTFMRIGNYPRALELNIEKLTLEESRNIPQNLASVVMNIGIVYSFQEEYEKALIYYKSADSIIRLHNVENLKYNIALNTGDTYDKLNKADSAFKYFSLSLALAEKVNDIDLIGTSMTGMGHAYFKKQNYPEAQKHYNSAIAHLKAVRDDEILCEATLGLAKLYKTTNQYDSAHHYASYSLTVAKENFLAKELEAADFLLNLHREKKNFDSAFVYLDKVKDLNDFLNSKSNIRKSQIISSNENLRQLELAEQREKDKKQRNTQLQLLLIAVFILTFFILTLLISRVMPSTRFIRLLGVLSLLFFFEFLTLFIHPTVAKITHHTPVLELIILVGIAALIIPLHHRMEHWIIKKLIAQREKHLIQLRFKEQEKKEPPVPTDGLENEANVTDPL